MNADKEQAACAKKRHYPTENEAVMAAARFQHHNSRNPLYRSYLCPVCGAWSLTSDHQPRRRKPKGKATPRMKNWRY